MNILDGVKNLLQLANDNWTIIVVIISLIIGIYQKIKLFITKTNEEKIEIAKTQIKELTLKLVTDAECTYSDWIKSGEIKRSEVIGKIFSDYPILQKAVNQKEIIKFIDETINSSLKSLNKICK